ncbi:alpha/beta hydrolase [Streptodolium elevatio]|uniref:Alpha/beta hydrolase n=1 Tax=Streptodolium elevatio TaxID=3157996 RepID=A0ABV3DXU6_9ACTN
MPPFDPELGVALRALSLSGDGPRESLTLDNLAEWQERDGTSRPRPTAADLRGDGRYEVAELRVPGPPGAPDVTLVIVRPSAAVGPLPLLYYMHGGAMVMGNAWSVLPRIVREWALPLQFAVISVEYRLVPQVRYPAPLDDCHAGLVWVVRHADELGVDPLGDVRNADDPPPSAVPGRAADLSGVPPAYIDVGSAEMFRDEDVAYANAIWQAGGQAELHVWSGGCHGFDGIAPVAAISRDARTRLLRRLLLLD